MNRVPLITYPTCTLKCRKYSNPERGTIKGIKRYVCHIFIGPGTLQVSSFMNCVAVEIA